jgi:hypothetical protein
MVFWERTELRTLTSDQNASHAGEMTYICRCSTGSGGNLAVMWRRLTAALCRKSQSAKFLEDRSQGFRRNSGMGIFGHEER